MFALTAVPIWRRFHYVDGPKQPTYRVTFYQKDLWEGYHVSRNTSWDMAILQFCVVLKSCIPYLIPSHLKQLPPRRACGGSFGNVAECGRLTGRR